MRHILRASVRGGQTADMFGDVYWQRPRPASRAPLRGDARADVAIIGAGIGGLAAAWHLANRGVRSIVVEARGVASGASGRNGGFLIAGAAAMYNDARRQFGADVARRIYRATLDAQDDVIALAAKMGVGDAIQRVGLLRLAVDRGEVDHVAEHCAALAEDGFPGEMVDAAALPEAVRRPDRAGLWTGHDASVHPVRLLRALADVLTERGVTIVEGTTVRAISATEGGVVVTTAHGAIEAAHAVVAADGAVATLVPEFRGRIRPRRLHMVATAPGARPHVAHPVYARYGYEYHQQRPDGTIVLGGFSDLDGVHSYTDREDASPLVHDRLAAYLRDDLGVDEPVASRWVGIVGYTDDGRPFVGPTAASSRVFVMGGYCGTGNLCAWVGARIVAEMISTGMSVDADLFDSSRPAV